MHDTHAIAMSTQEIHVIEIDEYSPLISVAGMEGIEEVTTTHGITSKYNDNKIRMSGKSTKQAKTEGGT